jgi:hypothetical protein
MHMHPKTEILRLFIFAPDDNENLPINQKNHIITLRLIVSRFVDNCQEGIFYKYFLIVVDSYIIYQIYTKNLVVVKRESEGKDALLNPSISGCELPQHRNNLIIAFIFPSLCLAFQKFLIGNPTV